LERGIERLWARKKGWEMAEEMVVKRMGVGTATEAFLDEERWDRGVSVEVGYGMV